MLSSLPKLVPVLLLLASCCEAKVTVRGALILHELSGDISISHMGEEEVNFVANQIPVPMQGLIGCRANNGSYVFLSASNRSTILFEGDGSFTIDRFEQAIPDLVDWQSSQKEASQSRVILNFREGQITIDNTDMFDSSQYLVETPLGSIKASGALWQMRISFDPGSQRFDFRISCRDGLVRFTDFTGKTYSLRNGQRLSGAGSQSNPSIEVGAIAERTNEQIQLFLELARTYSSLISNLAAYEPYFQVIEQDQIGGNKPIAKSDKTLPIPIVIEYSNDPPVVTPFRGEVGVPSMDEMDLF